MRSCWGALKDFSLNNSQVSSFDCEYTRMIDYNFINAFYTRKLHFKLSWIHSSCSEWTSSLVKRRLLHKMSSYELRRILVLHHLHFTSSTRHNVWLLVKRWSHLRIHHKVLLWLTTSHLRKWRRHQHYVLAATPSLLCCLRLDRS